MFEEYPDLLTRSQCQELLCVGKNTMLSLLQNNEIPSIMLGNSYRIKRTDLSDFIEKKVSAIYR